MASRAWFMSVMAAFQPTDRFQSLFSKSDRQLAAQGFDRNGLTRSHITGIAGF